MKVMRPLSENRTARARRGTADNRSGLCRGRPGHRQVQARRDAEPRAARWRTARRDTPRAQRARRPDDRRSGRRRGDVQPPYGRRVRRGRPADEHVRHAERPALRRALRPQQHRPDRRHGRRRHRRARGLGPRRGGHVSRDRRRQGRHRRHRRHPQPRGPRRQDDRLWPVDRRRDHERRLRRRQRPRHPRRRHDHRQREQRPRRRRRGVQLAAVDLQGAERPARPGHDPRTSRAASRG